jgi:hypothetical protein
LPPSGTTVLRENDTLPSGLVLHTAPIPLQSRAEACVKVPLPDLLKASRLTALALLGTRCCLRARGGGVFAAACDRGC